MFSFIFVDYFSLDVEGSELDILKTIPFDRVDIKVSTCLMSQSVCFKEIFAAYWGNEADDRFGILCLVPMQCTIQQKQLSEVCMY